jgi:serine/threonine protein phosphatase PrpC
MPPPSEAAVRELARRLDQAPSYRTLELVRFGRAAELDAPERFAQGDLVRVPRTAGHCSLGVVAYIDPGTHVASVIVRSGERGRPSLKDLDLATLARANPLHIGDYVVLDGSPFWVTGLDADGELVVVAREGQPVDPRELRARLEGVIAGEHEQTLQLTAPAATVPTDLATLRARERMDGRTGAYVPIERILDGGAVAGLIAGTGETDTVFGLKSPLAEAAVHTDRGRNYKAWNEDGAALFADGAGRLFVGVFDQAGGEGAQVERGAASALAAEVFFHAMRAVAEAGGGTDEAEAALHDAAHRGHEALLARGRGEVTTFLGAMVDAGEARVVNVGDSAALHLDPRGRLIAATVPEGLGRILLQGLGMLKKRHIEPRTYRWSLSRGDYLVFGSDGLFDARLDRESIGRLIAEAGSAADATRRLRDVVRARMASREAKPDNLTALVIRVGDRR